jgi:DNA repair protein RadC
LFDADSGALKKLGFDELAQARVSALARLHQHWAEERIERGKVFAKGQDFYEHFHLRLRSQKKELFYVMLLDQRNALIAEERVSEGSLTQTMAHPREVFALAVAKRAASVAVVHNHPSGDPTPSVNDKAMTKRLHEAAQVLGITLLDHVIIGDGKFVSFVDEGLLS